jgi:transcription initiation factor TFIIB
MEQFRTVFSCQNVISSKLPASLQASRSVQNLLSAFRDISNWCHQFSLPKTISDIVKRIYKRSYEARLLRRKPVEAVIAACIFVACRQAQVPRTFREICNIMGVSKKVLGQCYKGLERAFGLGTSTNPSSSGAPSSTELDNLLVRYCNHLNLSAQVQSVCSDIIAAAREHGITDGRSPISIAGGALYFTCHLLGKAKSVRDVCAVAGLSECTIREVYRLYFRDKENLVKQEWIDEGKAKLNRLP